jgi:hypothetical protein
MTLYQKWKSPGNAVFPGLFVVWVERFELSAS